MIAALVLALSAGLCGQPERLPAGRLVAFAIPLTGAGPSTPAAAAGGGAGDLNFSDPDQSGFIPTL